MIDFTPMTDAAFPAWQRYFVAEYAQEIVENYRLSEEKALRQAALDVEHSFPDGAHTRTQVLVNLMHRADGGEQHIGYLWYTPNEAMRSVYICDFYLFPDCRGQGFGKAAMRALEQRLAQQGFSEIKLRVAAHNNRARRVYDACGFEVTGINMNKVLDATHSDGQENNA
ncbi:GNAT family N-acetyltransferase [Enterobacteriaceae bacterium]